MTIYEKYREAIVDIAAETLARRGQGITQVRMNNAFYAYPDQLHEATIAMMTGVAEHGEHDLLDTCEPCLAQAELDERKKA